MNRSLDAVILRYLGYTLLFGAVAFLIYLVRGALPVFLIAGLIAYALEPILKWLERRGHSRRGAVGYVFLVFLLIFLLLAALLATAWQQVQGLAEQAPQYQEQFIQVIRGAQDRLQELRLPTNIKQSVIEGVADFQNRAPQMIATKIQGAVSWTLASISLLLLLLVVVPIVTLWLMLEMNPLRARILILIPAQYRRDVTLIATNINEMLGRYVRGQIIVCSLFGVLCTIAFYALYFLYGMEYPLVLGGLAAVMYIVPYLGMATIAISAGLIAYFTSSAPIPCTLLAIGSCLVFNLVLDYVVTPRVIGQGVGLHPLLVIFALLAGAQLGGPLGMILAIPFFAALRVIAIHLFPQLAVPISDTPPEIRGASVGESAQEIMREASQHGDPPPSPDDPAATAGSR
jgi:predicted PurR-regulated permease PerM